MTEDILFDNIYVGHSVEDAKILAAETFDIKKPLEVAAKKGASVEEEDEDELTFSQDPIGYIREKVLDFIDLAKLDPLLAFKTHPETGGALAAALFTVFGMIGAIFGLVGSAQKPVITKVCLYRSVIWVVVDIHFSPQRRLMPLPLRRRLLLPLPPPAVTRRKMTPPSRSASRRYSFIESFICIRKTIGIGEARRVFITSFTLIILLRRGERRTW